VPADAPHRTVRRRQFKTNADRLRRRRMRRKGETAEQAAAAIPDSVERTPDLPYVQLRSASTGQPFCLFIEQKEGQGAAGQGGFNTYGLSLGASVPWF
jgi:CRISPR-associated endonuclease Csy4